VPENGEYTRIEVLPTEECLDLLAHGSYVGRVGFVADAGRPMIVPVNYTLDNGAVVFCTAPGTKLSHLSQGVPVVFEVDSDRPLYNAGWSVIVEGSAHEVTDPEELQRLRLGPLQSWGVPSSQHWVRIPIEAITGRRIPET
jgi:nitroimidazol reductase NimA-like FMN-containing flavoprotein (pyridoxamine 5'-phosphate oxidase superfamily)